MHRQLRTIAAMAALGLVTTLTGWSPAGADDITSFEARANADGFRYTFAAPGFVAVDTFIDGGGPVSQSVLDGLGNSQSFASLPYPSDTAISGPGLVSGLTGLPSLPPYPFYANSSYPTQEKSAFTQPGLDLKANSAETSTDGAATSGGGSGDSAIFKMSAHTSATRDVEAGTVTAEAVTNADMINIGGVLKIASGFVKAKVVRSAGGEAVRESSLKLDGVSIGGQPVGFNEKGFVLASNGAPIPADNPLMDALRQAGIDVRYLAGTQTENGVVAPVVVITHKVQVPEGPTMFFTYTIGRASASATVS